MNATGRRGRPAQANAAPQKGTQALERGIAILQYLAESGGSASVTVLSEKLDLPLSTSFRLLKTLENAGFIYQDAQLGWWHIGLGLFTVGSSYSRNSDVVSVARPFMRRLMALSGETANLAICNSNEAVLISQCECQSMIRMCAPIGSRLPLHASGAGKALIYSLPEEEILEVIVSNGLKVFTDNTLNSFNQLIQDLAQSKQRGFSIDNEEHAIGLNCIASAIFNQNHDVVASVSISGPSTRVVQERFEELGKLVHTTAQNISTALGYQPV
ncbi:IclR family transcriptional regulator domain-containing protein [Pragia fontium]|uniref:HTH-type transcriptional repressor AllR n=1 Tax=Pragia fontium TaxID=82985 RepID=A0ABQ5LHC7_9GAMM|nr:IclR family transcriptional regulator C-terminal domain-containing protein [Pragia fontium]AKJ41249.1 transcriptional regulator [Pragia fontium]GKX62789.1 transcriptional regulator [Pragia fontium]SUB81471.1 Negative regulator of allantoin and glyoxylate utilization operons [Pragia fontium]VEJ53781.1 Negative regulator of allantoin and glyoxylate utilization operons [Pragia fontium]